MNELEFRGAGYYVFKYDIFKRHEHWTLCISYYDEWSNQLASFHKDDAIYIWDEHDFWTTVIAQIKKLALYEKEGE